MADLDDGRSRLNVSLSQAPSVALKTIKKSMKECNEISKTEVFQNSHENKEL